MNKFLSSVNLKFTHHMIEKFFKQGTMKFSGGYEALLMLLELLYDVNEYVVVGYILTMKCLVEMKFLFPFFFIILNHFFRSLLL